jgi:hypothetical protein
VNEIEQLEFIKNKTLLQQQMKRLEESIVTTKKELEQKITNFEN